MKKRRNLFKRSLKPKKKSDNWIEIPEEDNYVHLPTLVDKLHNIDGFEKLIESNEDLAQPFFVLLRSYNPKSFRDYMEKRKSIDETDQVMKQLEQVDQEHTPKVLEDFIEGYHLIEKAKDNSDVKIYWSENTKTLRAKPNVQRGKHARKIAVDSLLAYANNLSKMGIFEIEIPNQDKKDLFNSVPR